MGKFLRHLRNICTIKSFPMKKFERSDDSKLHTFINCWWLLIATKNNQPTKPKYSFWSLLEFCHFRKKNSTTIFFLLKIKFSSSWRFWAQVLKKVYRGLLSNRDIQWVKLIKTIHIHTQFYFLGNFSGVRKWRNSISGSDKIEIFIYKVSFTLLSVVELIHNSTNAKEQKKNWTSQCLQKRASRLVLSLPEQKKIEDFLFLPIYITGLMSYNLCPM